MNHINSTTSYSNSIIYELIEEKNLNKKLTEENKNLKREIERLRKLLDLLGGDD